MARRFLAAGALVFASLLLTAACLELAFRWLWPQRADGASMYTPHPEMGWSFAQNRRSAVVLNGVYAHYVRTNAHGFRDAHFEPLPPGSRRVAARQAPPGGPSSSMRRIRAT